MALFTITGGILNVAKSQLRDFSQESGDDADAVSLLGTPVFDRLTFQEGSYQTLEGVTINYGKLDIDSVIITVSMAKNIVTTAIQGRKGTIKEFVSEGDYQISIEGVLWNKQNKYPTEDVSILQAILNVPGAVEITSNFLNLFGIYSAVVSDYSFPQEKGNRNSQKFSISLMSDTLINLEQS